MSTKLRSLPLLLPALGWLLGLVLARSDTISMSVCLATMGLVSLITFRWRERIFIACLLALVYGLFSFALDVQRVQIGSVWLDQRVDISASIEDVKLTRQYTKLRLKDVALSNGESLLGFADVYLYRNKQVLLPDMSIEAKVKFHLPRNKLNPDIFDYEQYAFEQHIAVIGSVSGGVTVKEYGASWLTQMRQQIRESLKEVDAETQGVLLALLLADRSQIPLAVDDAFAAGGASHLLAISGLHMSLVASWGFMLAWWLFTRREAWIVNIPVRAASLSVGLFFAFS